MKLNIKKNSKLIREEELYSPNNYYIFSFPLLYVIVITTVDASLHLASTWNRDFISRLEHLTHSTAFLNYTMGVIDAQYVLFYSAGGYPAREMHAIAIKLAWVIALTLCSRDMGSIHLESKNTEKSRRYKDYLKSKGHRVVSLRIMASPRRSLYILVHLSFLNQLHRPVYNCQETLREMHTFPLDKMLQITALRRL